MLFAIFCFFAAFVVVSSLVVILARNPITSAVALLSTLIGVAGLFAILNSGFLAVVQILVYGGAVVTLFVFVIMLLNLSEDELEPLNLTWQKLFGVVIAGMILGICASTMKWMMSSYRVAVGGGILTIPLGPEDPGFQALSSLSIGEVLFTRFLFPFEVTSIVLLAAIVGVVTLGRKGETA